MKKDPYNVSDLDSMSESNQELITEKFSHSGSSPELVKDYEQDIFMKDEENMGCLLEDRAENDVIDLFGNIIIDDF
tara:strand:- start:143 stop:370 length:228 start_codon:yes stop_codon:yes gene_type:complete